MTKGNKQNGRQPPVSQVSAPSTATKCKNASTLSLDREKICRDFIWGICIKGARCAYRHERDLDHMKTVLKFCHDFQNKSGCIRPDCTYLHTSREEQSLFINKGRIPKVLADRYAAMAAASAPDHKVINQMTFNIESMPMQSGTTLPLPSVVHQQPPATPLTQLLLQPPPPPPPTVVTTTVQATVGNVLTTATPQVPKPILNQHPQLPAIIDVSHPPPQLTRQITGAQKRPMKAIEAGPCKARKQEAPNVIETLCDNCVQRELRIEILQDDNQKLQTQKDCKALLIEKNKEEYENAKLILKPLVKPELYQILEEYLEKLTSDLVEPEALLEINPAPSPMGMSNPAKEIMKHLLDRAITNETNHALDARSISNGNLEDTHLSSLSSSPRSKSDSTEDSATELIQTLLFIYKGSVDNIPDKSLGKDASVNPIEKLISEPQSSTSGLNISMFSELTHYLKSQNDKCLQVVKTNGITSPMGLVPHVNSIENSSSNSIPFQPTVLPPGMRPMIPPPSATNTPNIPNKIIPNPIASSSPAPMIRPYTSPVRPSMFSLPPPRATTKQSPKSVSVSTVTVRHPSKSASMMPMKSPTLQLHRPTAPMSILPVSLIEQSSKLTVQPPASTIQSSAVTISSPTSPARQPSPITIPVSVQGPRVLQNSTVVQSPRATSQQLGPVMRFTSQTAKIFIPRNGHIPPPRPHLPPFQ